MPGRICVVGSLNVDLVVRAPRIPDPGETVLGNSFNALPGGKGANQAVAAARLGAETAFVGAIGDDDNGTLMMDALRGSTVQLDAVRVLPNCATGVAAVCVDATTGENSIVVVPGANAKLTATHISASAHCMRAASVALLQLETPLDVVAAAAKQAKALGCMVVLNPAPAVPLPESLLRNVDVLIPNESELPICAGKGTGAEDPLAKLRAMCHVIVTLGSRGCLVGPRGSDAVVAVPSFTPPGPVLDTTGAGDCFCAAIAVRLAEDASPLGGELLAAAARFAATAAALSVTKRGAQPSLPDRETVLSVWNQDRGQR